MIALFWTAVILAAAYSLGAGLLSRCQRLVLDGAARKILLRGGLGLAALGYAMLAVGLVGLARPAAAWLLLGAALLAGVPTLRREARQRAARLRQDAATPLDFARELVWPHAWPGGGWPRLATLLVVVVLALLAGAALLLAFAPPAAYDDLTYHLAAAKVYARTGRVTILPYDHHTAFPLTLEMLYTLALLVGDDTVARLVATAFWALTLLAIGVLGGELLGPRAGWLAVLCYAATPLVHYQAGTGYTEFGFALCQLLGWLCFADYLNLRATAVGFEAAGAATPAARQPQWLGPAALFAGLTYGTKYTGVLVVAFLLGALVVLAWRDGLPRRAVRADALRFGLIAALVAAPWIARTWLATGNPVFPFAHGVFRSPLWSDDRAGGYDAAQRDFGRRFTVRDGALVSLEPTPTSHRGLGRLLTVPWHLTFSPDWFYDKGLNFDGKAQLGPAWLAFGLPALGGWLAVRRRSRPDFEELRDETTTPVYRAEFGREVPVGRTRQITERVTVPTGRVVGLLLAHLVLQGGLWFMTMQYARYLVPHLALWALLVGWGADGLLRLRVAPLAAGAVLLCQVAGGLRYAERASYPALQVALGGLTRDQYAGGSLPAYRGMRWLSESAAADARVILYGEPRGYWLDRDYLWGERGHHTLIPDAERATMQRYVAFLREQLGVRYALVFEPVFATDRVDGGDDVALVTQAIRAGRFRLVWQDERRPVKVYAVE